MGKRVIIDAAHAFDFKAYATYADFTKAANDYVAATAGRNVVVSKIILAAAVYVAMTEPNLGVTAIADSALDAVAAKDTTLGQYASHIKGAIGYAREKGLLPTCDGSQKEADTMRKVASFVGKHTLRALYDAYRAPKTAKREDAKATADAERATATQQAREALQAGDTSLDVLALQRAFSPFIDAANAGDENARRVLLALGASIECARVDWNAKSADLQIAA